MGGRMGWIMPDIIAPSSIAGAIESITCSRWPSSKFSPTNGEIMTLYIEWTRIDGSHGQRSNRFVWNPHGRDVDNQVMWSECFSAEAFDPHNPSPSVIPVICDVVFCQQVPEHPTVHAYLVVASSGSVFELPIHDYRGWPRRNAR
jgi:hypothetical protein